MQFKIYILFLSCIVFNTLQGQSSAEMLLDKSIAFHDPKGNWEKFQGQLDFTVVFPGKPDAKRKVIINNEQRSFSFWAYYEEGILNYEVANNQGTAQWNDKTAIPDEFAKKYRISNDRAVMYRDYYTYLYGMPMKLKDKGTIIHPEVMQIAFHGKMYNRIKVTYEPEVGTDIWYFYFHPTTHALEAYQFFKDESKNDGEYILFEELKEIYNVKIPKNRKWYYNKNEKFLATDILE